MSGECWTCGKEIPEEIWKLAPAEPTNSEKRQCIDCHNTIEIFTADPLKVMNMIRYAAGLPLVADPMNN